MIKNRIGNLKYVIQKVLDSEKTKEFDLSGLTKLHLAVLTATSEKVRN